MAFQRFCAENSTPRFILSDNASEYVRASKELQAVLKTISSDEVRKTLGEKGFIWRFSPAVSPQHNSVSESLIKGAKDAIYKTFTGKHLTETELTTAMKLAQARMNSRPVMAISDNKEDGNLLTLTPHHLKMGKPLTILLSSLNEIDIEKLQKMKIATRWNQRKILKSIFFVRFIHEYFDSLKKLSTDRQRQQLKVNDVVLLMNERKTKHDAWPIAKVEQVLTSHDGIVR